MVILYHSFCLLGRRRRDREGGVERGGWRGGWRGGMERGKG